MTPYPVTVGSHDHGIIALSILVSVLGAYAALELTERTNAARGSARRLWLVGGGTASGIGTWSMHYTAMLGFSPPVPILYHWPTVVVSFVPAALSAVGALFLVSPRASATRQALAGAILMGGGIATLHYVAMAAMRLPAMQRYSAPMVALSVVLPMVISLIPLHLSFWFNTGTAWPRVRKLVSVLSLGATNPVMHYTGMASVTFVPSATPPELTNAVSVASIGAVGIAIVPLMVIVVALVTSFVDRLREQRALLDDLFEQAPQAVALMAGDGRIVRVNREFSQLFGYTSHEAVGRHLDEVIVPEDARDEDRRYADLVARGQRVEAECVCRRKDGSLLYVSMVRVPVSVPGGRVAIYAIYRDVSERKRSEGALQRSLEQLRALTGRLQTVREEERTRVAREIHDVLGQALTAIKLDVTALLRDAPTGKGAGIMRLLDETIQSVRRLATELRPGILDDLGLEAAVEWAAEDFEARTGTRVHMGLPAERLAADPERATALFRILQETLTNVARHASATRVDVRLASAGGSLILEMHDNGIGMSEVHLSSVASLGIMGMRERARLLGGEVTIRSASGQGTTVTVRIPDA